MEGSVLDRDQLMEDSVGEAVRLCRRSGTRLCISSCDIKSIQRHKSFDSQQPKVKWGFFSFGSFPALNPGCFLNSSHKLGVDDIAACRKEDGGLSALEAVV